MDNNNIKQTPLNKPIIFLKTDNTNIIKAANIVLQHLSSLKISFQLDIEAKKILPRNCHPPQTTSKPDCVIVIGGDGSLLSAIKKDYLSHLPFIGINLGNLGFLTDINPNDLITLKQVLQGRYQLESRNFLTTKFNDNEQHLAFNDIVVSRCAARLLNFEIFINKEFICSQRADGVIIASPTGSTAYALSAGGPIVHPNIQAISIVPLCPHRLNSRPIIVPSDSNIDIYITQHQNMKDSLISCDGISINSKPSQINIKQSTNSIKLIHHHNYSYFNALKSKLHWENTPEINFEDAI